MTEQININDLEAFEASLEQGYDVNGPYENELSLFELMCKTPGKKDFIRACLSYSANYNMQNSRTNKYPIHLAAESLDSENLGELLKMADLEIDAKYEDRTALFLLFAKLTLKNREQIISCIKMLLRKGANINATNEDNVSPVTYLVDLCNKKGITEKEKLYVRHDLEFFIQKYSIEWDFRNGLLKRKIKSHFPSMYIPTNDEIVTIEVLRNLLSTSEINDRFFIAQYDKYSHSDTRDLIRFIEDHKELVEKAVEVGCLQIIQHLMNKMRKNEGWDKNSKELKDFYAKLLEKCCNRGHAELLKWLLLNMDVMFGKVETIEEPLLSVVVKQMSNCRKNNIHECKTMDGIGIRDCLLQCLNVLLEDSKVDVNQPDKEKSRTALYYAAKLGEDDAILKLLSGEAYLGVANTKDQPLQWINAKVLKTHLDQCVSCNNEDEESEEFMLTINFKNFIPPSSARDTNDTRTMMQMAELPNINRLLGHPVLASIIMLKWQKLEPLLIANLVAGCILFGLLTWLLQQRPDEKSWILYWLTGAFILLREIMQGFAYGRTIYFSSIENYIELLLIVAYALAPWFMFATIAAFLLSALQFMQMLSSLRYWSFSMHFVMLQKVCINFLKCLVLFASMIVSFALCFHVVFRDRQLSNSGSQFDKLGFTFMKIMVMFTGEFDAGSMNFDQADYSMVVFMLFLFCCHLVLLNVINGIAVSDSWDVKLDSKLVSVKTNLSVIEKYEKIYKIWSRLKRTSQQTPIQSISVQPNKKLMKIKTSKRILLNASYTADNSSNIEEGDNSRINTYTSNMEFSVKCSDSTINIIVEKAMKIVRNRAKGSIARISITSVEEIVNEVLQKLAEREGNVH